MIDATEDQIMHRRRWISTPLREKYESGSVDEIRQIAGAKQLSDAQRDELFRIAGLVLLAFIHPDNVSSEIREALNIDRAQAELLARHLENQVFGPYRSLIERKYAPPTPVPPNSPIYAVSCAYADKYLRSALERAAEVESEIFGHRLSARGTEREHSGIIMSPQMHDHLRRLLDIALAEVAYAQSLDPEMVVFLSDDEFLDSGGVRRFLYATTSELDHAAGMIASARESVARALSISEDAGTHMIAATLNAALGDFEVALKHARRCIALDPNGEAGREAHEFMKRVNMAMRQVRIRHIPRVHLLNDDAKYLSEEDVTSIGTVLLLETERPVRSCVVLVKGPSHDYAEVMLFDTETITQDLQHLVAAVYIHKQAPGKWAPGLRPSLPHYAVFAANAPASETLYYVHTKRDDMTYGPVTGIMVQEWLQARCVLRSDMICVVGAKQWKPIHGWSLATTT